MPKSERYNFKNEVITMYVLFELAESNEAVIRRPIGVYKNVNDGFNWIRTNYESYKDVFCDGEEQLYSENFDTKTVKIKYVGGCQPGDFIATYVMCEYMIGQPFADLRLFDGSFYTGLSEVLETI